MAQSEPVRLLRIGFAEYKRIFDIHGRSNRTQFWTFAVINIGLSQAMMSATFLLFRVFVPVQQGNRVDPESFNMLLVGMFGSIVVLLPPYFSSLIRRLHDSGKSGFWALPHLVFLFVGLVLMPRLFFFGPGNGTLPVILFMNNVVHLAYSLVIIVLATRRSVDGPNRYGEPQISEERLVG